jgi:hypothetical protein
MSYEGERAWLKRNGQVPMDRKEKFGVPRKAEQAGFAEHPEKNLRTTEKIQPRRSGLHAYWNPE